MSETDPLLIANLGGEEPEDGGLPPPARVAAALWRFLFGAGARLVGAPELPWPEALEASEDPAWDFLGAGSAYAWFNSAAAVERAKPRTLFGADAGATRRVHDKAFSLTVARDEELEPRGLEGCFALLSAEELEEPGAARERILEMTTAWPEACGDSLVLKPRLAGAGRGQRRLRRAELVEGPPEALLAGLAERGGAVVEPLLSRVADFASQWLVEEDGSLRMLGSACQEVDARGAYRGHSGVVDSRGRARTDGPFEEELRESGARVVQRAAEAGYVGPCGVDAMSFRDAAGVVRLRPVVELNARFTMGTVALGLLRRALAQAKRSVGLAPGELRRFRFELGARGSDAAPHDPASSGCSADDLVVPLGGGATLRVLAD